MIKSYFFKILHSPLFFLSSLAAFALTFYSLFFNVHTFNDLYSEVDFLISAEFFKRIFVLLAALPFTSNFTIEFNSGIITSCVTRKNVVNYALDNAIMTFLTAFASVFLGIMLGVFVRMPFNQLYSGSNPSPYAVLSEYGMPLLVIVLVVFVYAFSCAMYSVVSLAATAFLPSRYIAVCAPFVLSYIIEKITSYFGEFSFISLAQSWSGFGPVAAFFKSVIVFSVISVLCTVIFTAKVKARVENGLS